MKDFRKIPLFVKILLGMIAGVIIGYALLISGHENIVSTWIKPWGTIFIRLLKLIAVPLVFVSLIKGVAGMKDLKRLSGIGIKTFALYIVTTLFAVSFGAGMVNIIKPGKIFLSRKSRTI
jgi:Na+/H+-dicarboxylate symporter